MKQIRQFLFYHNRVISFSRADWSRAMVDAVQKETKSKKKLRQKGSRSRRGRYQPKIEGHRSQVQVTALLIN